MTLDPDDEPVRALGWVPVEDRGSLPFALLRGESLVACASWALGEAEVDLVDFNVSWGQVQESGRDLVVHDPLCPLTPPAFVAEAVGLCRRTRRVVLGVTPDGRVASPVVLPATLLAALGEAPDVDDLESLAQLLGARTDVEVERLVAPATAGRVTTVADLDALDALADRAQEDPAAPLR